MAYFFWDLLNIGLYGFFLVICFQATKLIRQKMGLVATLVFVFGLMAFVSSARKPHAPVPSDPTTRTIGIKSRTSTTPDAHHRLHSTLYKYWTASIELTVETGIDTTSKKPVPVEVGSYMLGSASGHTWQPIATVVSITDDQNLVYDIAGILHWNLFGATIYSEPRQFTGTLDIP